VKDLKKFDTKKELNAAITALENAGIRCEHNNDYVLRVHIGDFIKARDVLLDAED